MSHKVAIDFGTTNSVVAEWQDGQAKVLSLSGLSIPDAALPLIPSLVYIEDGRAHTGQAVLEMQLDHRQDNRLFRNLKRGIVARPPLPARKIDDRLWSYRDIATGFLNEILDNLPPIDQLVLTVPVAAFEDYLVWISDIASRRGISPDSLRIVDESTAAALGYAVQEAGAPVLVVDFGGGTLDLSLVQLPEQRTQTGGFLNLLRRDNSAGFRAKVIAKAGQLIGGSDIDQWLVGHVLNELNLTPGTLDIYYAPLLSACEQGKIDLTAQENTTLNLETPSGAQQVTITRHQFDALLETNGLFSTLRHTLDKVMQVARQRGIYKEDVHYVLLVGGTSLIPAIQVHLQDYFSEHAVRADKPFTAVVEGALQLAAGMGLQDYISHGYALRYLDENSSHQYEEIIPMGHEYPGPPVEIALEAAHQQQDAIELVIGEISDEAIAMMEVQYEGDQMVFVAQADTKSNQVTPLNADDPIVMKLSPPGIPGQERLIASFHVDASRHLKVSVIDLETSETLVENQTVVGLK